MLLFFNQIEPSAFAAKFIDRRGTGQCINHRSSSKPELGTAASGANATEAAADSTAETLPGERPNCTKGKGCFIAGNVNITVAGDGVTGSLVRSSLK